MTRVTHNSILAILAMAVVMLGCNVSTPGTKGNIEFVPSDCGRYTGCDFAEPIGVGGIVETYIMGIDDFDATGVMLQSDDPAVLTVTFLGDVAGRPTWEFRAVSAGTATILGVLDRSTIDSIEVDVAPVARLSAQKILGEVNGPLDDAPEYDEHWIVAPDQRVVLHVTPLGSGDNPLMGKYEYTYDLDDSGFDAYINNTEILGKGQLDFSAPVGQYGITFSDSYEHSLSMLIDVQAAAF